MRNLWIVSANILKRMFKKPVNFLIHLALPVVTSLVMFFVFSSDSSGLINMAVVDEDDSLISRAVLSSIDQTGKFNLIRTNEAEAEKMIASNSVSFGYFIAEDFEESILNRNEPAIDVVSVGENEGTAWIRVISDYQIKNIIDMALASDYDMNTLSPMLAKLKDGNLKLVSEFVSDESNAKSVVSQSIGMYIMILMISVSSVSFLILEERERGTFARIGTAPVYSKIYTLSNIFVSLILVTVQICLVLGILSIANMNFFMPTYILFIIVFVFALAGISLGLMLAAFSKEKAGAGALISLVITPTCLIAGCFWPIEMMPEYMRKLAYLLPQRWTLDAISSMQVNNDFVSILPNLMIVFGFALLFFLISAYQFENQDKKIG